jgi:hypothetical protein
VSINNELARVAVSRMRSRTSWRISRDKSGGVEPDPVIAGGTIVVGAVDAVSHNPRRESKDRLVRACSHYPQRFDDERKAEKRQEHDVEFFKTRKDAAEAFEAPEQPLDLVALLVQGTIIFPRMQPVGLRWNYRNHAQIQHQLPGFIAFVSAVHQQRKASWHGAQLFQQGAKAIQNSYAPAIPLLIEWR